MLKIKDPRLEVHRGRGTSNLAWVCAVMRKLIEEALTGVAIKNLFLSAYLVDFLQAFASSPQQNSQQITSDT